VGHRASLDAVEKRNILTLPGIQPQPSLYQLSYPDFHYETIHQLVIDFNSRKPTSDDELSGSINMFVNS
jgi:hypothetical protein